MKVIATGGGTGGHIYPALAILDKIKEAEPDAQFLYVGNKDGVENKIVPRTAYPFVCIDAPYDHYYSNFIGKVKVFSKAGVDAIKSIKQAIGIIREFKPDVIIGTGGFASFPVLFAAKLMRKRYYIHEQNAVPGQVNLKMGKKASKIFLGVNFAKNRFKYGEQKLVYTGNPVRSDFNSVSKAESRKKLGIDDNTTVILAFGGSQGSRMIINLCLNLVDSLDEEENVKVILGTGHGLYKQVKEEVKGLIGSNRDKIEVVEYIDNMADTIGASDLVISRAGALSIAEITAVGRPALLIPLPIAKDNHQFFNAKDVEEVGGAILVEEKDIIKDLQGFAIKIKALYKDKEQLQVMSQAAKSYGATNAADKIYNEIKRDISK